MHTAATVLPVALIVWTPQLCLQHHLQTTLAASITGTLAPSPECINHCPSATAGPQMPRRTPPQHAT